MPPGCSMVSDVAARLHQRRRHSSGSCRYFDLFQVRPRARLHQAGLAFAGVRMDQSGAFCVGIV